jgi:NitT/TauT family transport system permease protein
MKPTIQKIGLQKPSTLKPNPLKLNKLIGVIILLLLWFVLSAFHIVDAFFLPGPQTVLMELLRLLITGTLNADIIATLARVASAFAIAITIGIPTGLILGASVKAYEGSEFVIDFFRSIPATAIFPLFLLIFGIEDSSKIAVAAFGALLLIIFNTAHGVMNSKKARIEAAKLMGASKFQIFKEIMLWESLPQTFIGLRTSLSLTLIVIIVTEMFIGTQFGLGRRIIDFQYTYSIAALYATIILTGIIGYLLNQMFALLEKKVVHWNGK